MTWPPTLINRDYTRLWFGQAVSSVGDAVFSTTLVLWVATQLGKGKPWAPEAVSGVLLATSVAVLCVGPIAGVFVDRWDKRRTMLRTETLRGGLVAALTVVSFLPTHALPIALWLALIYATVLVLNSASQFFSPARFTVIADLVTGEADRARAAGIAQATGETAWIIGPPLAAPLLFTVGLQWALLFNAASYAVSWAAIRSVRPGAAATEQAGLSDAPAPAPAATTASRPDAKKQTGLFSEFAAGLRFFGRSRFLVALLVLAVIGQFGIGALDTLNVFFTTRNLHASAHLYGYLGMAMGVGGITGALCGGRAVQWMGARRTTWVGLLVGGALLVVYSRQTTFIGGVVLLYVFAVPLTMLNTAMSPLLIAAAPPAYRGRVVAVFYPVTQLASMLAAVLAGWLAGSVLRGVSFSVAGAHFGPLDTIFAFSGVVVVLSGLYARAALPDPAKETDAAGADAAETGAAETEAPVANAADPGPVRPPDAVGRDAA